MDLPDYLRVLRRRWVWAVAALVVSVSATIAWVGFGPSTYASSQTLFLVGSGQDSTSADARLNSYAALVRTPAVLDTVREQLGRTEPAEDLSRRLTAQVQENTLILTVTAEDSSAQGARTLATSASQQLVALTSSLSAADEQTGRLVATDAATPAVPATNVAQAIGLALLLGLLLGVALALVVEAADTRVRSADQLRRLGAAAVPVVEIPDARHAVADADVPSGVRVLRAVVFRRVGRDPATLVVSSCDERYPFPEVAQSLGLALARAAVDVVLIFADLRPGHRTEADGMTELGLGDALTNGSAVDAFVRPGSHPRLWVVPQGRVVPYAQDALASSLMTGVVDSLHRAHDVVLVQAPPLDGGTDALAVAEAGRAAVVLTVARGRTHRRQVRAALAALASAGVPVVAVALVSPPRGRAAPMPGSPHAPAAQGVTEPATSTPASGAASRSPGAGPPSPGAGPPSTGESPPVPAGPGADGRSPGAPHPPSAPADSASVATGDQAAAGRPPHAPKG